MSEHLDSESSFASSGKESDVIALLKKIQQQMVFLEKKIDLLVSQQQSAQGSGQPTGERAFDRDRPSFKDKHFSKPYRSYGPPQGGFGGRPDRGPRDGGPRGGDGYGQGRPSFGRPRRDDQHRGPSGGGRPGFGGPKKPFYRGRKDRD
jgi:hypothetical protein